MLSAFALAVFFILIESHTAGAATSYSWLFNGTSTDGWSWANATCSTSGGIFNIHPTTSDPQTITPVIDFSRTSTDYVRTRITSSNPNGLFQIFYQNNLHGFSASFTKTYSINNDGTFHYYTVPLSGSHPDPQLAGIAGWTGGGNITRLRFDPASSTNGDVNYDFVVVRTDNADPYTPVVSSMSPPTWTNDAITVTAYGNDPPPLGFPGTTNPDIYGSGVFDFGWRIDGGGETWQQYTNGYDVITGTANLTLDFLPGSLSSGPHTLSLRSRDRCGRIGTSTTATLYFDNVSPGVPGTPAASPAGWSTTNSFAFSWAGSSDDASGISHYEYLLDGFDGPHSVLGTSVGSIAASSPGSHTFQVRAVDVAGNASGWGSAANFYFDNVPPPAPAGLAASPSGYTNINAFTMTWNAVSDVGSGVEAYEYRVNGGAVQSTTALAVSGALAAQVGSNTFELRARDFANQLSGWVSTTFLWDPSYLPPPNARAPAEAAPLALPEIFSWDPTANATAYEIRIAPGGNFNGPTWVARTTFTSVVVPTNAAPTTGSYGWQLRADGPSAPLVWGPTRSFLRVTAQGPPGTPALSFPPNGSIQAPGDVLFQWSSTTGATSYRLEVSTDPTFPAGTAGALAIEGNTSTVATVQLAVPDLALYWRVTARNSGGYGTPSGVASFTLGAAPPTLSGAIVLAPSSDLSVDQGASVLATGLVVGRYTGAVTAEWVLDDQVFSSSTLGLVGRGLQLDPVSVPTASIGVHLLRLRVFASDTVSSRSILLDVNAPGIGPPDHLVVVADQPELLANNSTGIYCTVRDADNALVLSDAGRIVHFAVTGGGGAVDPVDALTSAGVALSAYTAPTTETTPQVQVTSSAAADMFGGLAFAALTGDAVPMGVSVTSLAQERRIALAYLSRLTSLPVNGIPGAIPGLNSWLTGGWPGLNTANAVTFVNATTDVSRLHRLNIFLRYLDRLYFYDPSVNKIGPREAGTIFGFGTMNFDFAHALGTTAAAVFKLGKDMMEPFGAKKLQLWQRLAKPVMKMLSDLLLSTFDHFTQKLLQLTARNTAEKNASLAVWSRAMSAAKRIVHSRDNAALGYAEIVADGLVSQTVAAEILDQQYVRPIQAKLNAVVGVLGSQGWQGGSDGPSEAVVAEALGELRAKTDYQHRWYAAAQTALKDDFVSWCEIMATEAARLAPGRPLRIIMNAFKSFLFFIVKNSILVSSGYDCFVTGARATGAQATAVANTIVAYGGTALSMSTIQAAVGLKAVPDAAGGREPMPASVLEGATGLISAGLDAYEIAAHGIEQALLAADTTAAKGGLEAIIGAEPGLADAEEGSIGPLYASLESARLDVPDHVEGVDSLRRSLDAATASRALATAEIHDWIRSEGDMTLRDLALAQLRGALDTTRTRFGSLMAYLPVTLGEAAEPFVSLSTPSGPGPVLQGDIATVLVTATNTGSGVAQDVQLTLRGGNDMEYPTGIIRGIGDLAPGESREVGWNLRFVPTFADTDSVRFVSFAIAADSALSGMGSGRIGTVEVMWNPAFVGVHEAPSPWGAALAVRPNPTRGPVHIELSAPAPEGGRLELFDVSGRLVRTIAQWPNGSPPRSLIWDGRDNQGRSVRSGFYVLRLRAGGLDRVARIVKVR